MAKKLDADATATHKALLLYTLLLFSGKRYYLPELAQRFNCTKPTILRLMREIENTGITPVETGIKGRQRYFQITTPPGTPHISLSHGEVERLALCRDLLDHILPDGMERMISDGLAKISALMDNVENRAQATATKAASMVKGYIDYSPFQQHIDTLLKAIAGHTVCAVTYAAPNREPRVFEVVPVRFVVDGEVLNIDGWRVTEKGTPEIRMPFTLAIHRMRECVLTRRQLADCPELPEHQGAFGLIGDEPFPVRVVFDRHYAMHIKERLWSEDQQIRDLPDGGVELSFTATSPEQVMSWVLGFASSAELLEPESLRERIREEVEGLEGMYADTELTTPSAS